MTQIVILKHFTGSSATEILKLVALEVCGTNLGLSQYNGTCVGDSLAEGDMYRFVSPINGEDEVFTWCLDSTGDIIYYLLHEQGM